MNLCSFVSIVLQLCIAVLLAPFFAALLYTVLGVAVDTALLVNVVLSPLLLLFARFFLGLRFLDQNADGLHNHVSRAWPRGYCVLILCTCLCLSVLGSMRLYNPLLSGLVSVGGGDAADHVFYAAQLAEGVPQVYNQMIVFHTYLYTLHEVFGLGVFSSIRLLFYVSLWAFTSVAVCLLLTLSRGLFSLILGVGLIVFSGEYIVLPLLHYLQADGFYPQLFGLIPLICTCYALGYARSWVWSLVILSIGVIAQRYTYALHVPEFLCAAAVFYLLQYCIERRAMLLLCAGTSLFVGLAAYVRLRPVFELEGAVQEFSVLPMFCVLLFASGCMLLSMGSALRKDSATLFDSWYSRSELFACLFVALAALLAISRWLERGFANYYIYKSAFYPSIVLVFVALASVPHLCNSVVNLPNRLASYKQLLARSGLALFLVLTPMLIRPIRASYYERASSQLPLVLIQPLADLPAIGIVERVLKESGQRFGGMITEPRWALSHFTNAALGFHRYREQPLYRDPRIRIEPGYCVFWNSERSTLEALARVTDSWAAKLVEELNANPDSHTEGYSVAWNAEEKQLSHLCLE